MPDRAFFFFRNGFVEVSKDGIELKPYSQLQGFIWKSQITDHDFSVIRDKTAVDDSDFCKFTANICTDRASGVFDQNRWQSLVCTVGYLLHNYKTSANRFAVILTEANTDDSPQGRTGKGLLMQAVGKLRKSATVDGKNFSFDSPFAFQNVELDTQILFFDDVRKRFDFQRLYSAITEGLSVEKKHCPRFNLSPKDSPKIVISTNFAIQGNSESDRGRKYEMELLCYYNSEFRPDTQFGGYFFESWNTDQWNRFYNFMIRCAQEYFKHGGKIPGYQSETLEERRLYQAVGRDFVEYADDLERGKWLVCRQVYQDYCDTLGSERKPSTITFGKNLKTYCEFRKLDFEISQIRTDGKNLKHYRIITKN